MIRRSIPGRPSTVTSEPAMKCPACQQVIDMDCTWEVDREDVSTDVRQLPVIASAKLRLVKIAIHHVCSEYDSGS